MNTVKRFFRKYLFSSLLILLAFLVINAGLLLGVLIISWSSSTDPDIPISQIADCIHTDEHGTVYADEKASELLNEKSSWAMVLNSSGAVIWEEAMPSNLPQQYSAIEIAKFSRWYLEKYPVLTQEVPSGLLVIGCPPDSLVKYNFVTDANYIRTATQGIVIVAVTNIVFMLLLFWHNTRKVEKAVAPILNGIETISHGKEISLSENGELSEINAELNRAGTYILKKDAARAEWINGVSHDVRTPLSIILGYAGEIEEDSILPAHTKDQAGMIQKQAEKLRRLIADLNLASKLEYSMQPLKLETVYPVEIARQVITEYLNNGIEEKYSFELKVDENANALSFQGDMSLLERMLGNLIQNSISHNEKGCNIIVSVIQYENKCEFLISDNGVGVSAGQLNQFNHKIFAEKDSQDTIKHGLGLHLVSQIVAAHNGEISFSVNNPSGLKVSILFEKI